MAIRAWSLWTAVLLLSCNSLAQNTSLPDIIDFSVTTSKLAAWNQSTWSLTTNTLIPGQYQSRISLANGYVGASLAAAGPFFEVDVNYTNPTGPPPENVWPLFSQRLSFSTISGFYDIQVNTPGTNYVWLNQYGYESVIAGIPHSTGLLFQFGDWLLEATVSPKTISNFTSSISFKTGVATWSYVWSPANITTKFAIQYKTFFSRNLANVIAVEATIVPSADIQGNVIDILDGRSAVRSFPVESGLTPNSTSIYSAVHPNFLNNITAYVVSTADFANNFTDLSSRTLASGPYYQLSNMTVAQSFNISLKAGQPATFHKYIGVASSDGFQDPKGTATKASSAAKSAGWSSLLSDHTAAWATLLTEAKVDNYTDPQTGLLPEDPMVQILQITSVANTYYLLQNLLPDDGSGLNVNSIAVGGLASESYAGMIFWDADYWMAPGLNLAFPDYAKQISNYRLKTHNQALANAAFNGYPNGSALYSWTSGRYGNCTGTGPCVDYEYHLNYDITANFLQQFNITQNTSWWNSGPQGVLDSVALMTGQLLNWNSTTGSWWIHNMTDPDEYANNVDNGVFTIGSAADLLNTVNALRANNGQQVNSTWANQSAHVEFPRSPVSNITLEYETMNNSVQVKQADVVLLSYPADYVLNGYTEVEKLQDLDYYSNRLSPNGPAMTYSIHAIDANAVSPSGCAAYTYNLNGMLPYLRAPWFQFSEQNNDDPTSNGNNNPAFPFLTGHGGAHQVAPFGFLGLRTSQETLYINPSLPPQIPNLKLRTIYFAGAALSATLNSTHTTLTRHSTANLPFLTDKYANGSMPITVGLPGAPAQNLTQMMIAVNQTLTIPNRLYWQNLTAPGNLLQCLPAVSDAAYAQGQFPVAVNDGATATRWQPLTNQSASVLINMTGVPYQPVSSLSFDWGERPPKRAVVFFGNATAVDGTTGAVEINGSEIEIPVEGVSPNVFVSTVDVDVVPYVGNTTVVAVGDFAGNSSTQVWSGNYVRLVVEGCWVEDGMGAEVSEFVVLGGS